MEVLTEKQKAARAYYAKNAESIKAKKRAQYKASKPAGQIKKTSTKSLAAKMRAAKKAALSANDQQIAARKKIDDYLLARELGVDELRRIVVHAWNRRHERQNEPDQAV